MHKLLDAFNPIVSKRLNILFLIFGLFICCILIYIDLGKYYLVHGSPNVCTLPSSTDITPELLIKYDHYPVNANTLRGAVWLAQVPGQPAGDKAITETSIDGKITYDPITDKAICVNMIVNIRIILPSWQQYGQACPQEAY